MDVSRAALEVAQHIIAVVNPNMPRTFGDGTIHHSHIDFTVESDAPLFARHAKDKNTDQKGAEEAIGKLIAENLVENGSTLQMGIGGIPDAVLTYCTGHKDLGVHTEMFSGACPGAVAAGGGYCLGWCGRCWWFCDCSCIA